MRAARSGSRSRNSATILGCGVSGRDLRQRSNGAERRLNDRELTKRQTTEQVRGDQVERERAALAKRTADEMERDPGVKASQQRCTVCGFLAGGVALDQ